MTGTRIMKSSIQLCSQTLMVAFLLKGNVQGNGDIQKVYDGTCSNAQGCCRDVGLL